MAETTSSEDGHRPTSLLFERVRNWLRAHTRLAIVTYLAAQLSLSYLMTCGGFEDKDRRLLPLWFGVMILAISLIDTASERARWLPWLLVGLFLGGSWALDFGFRTACPG